MGWLSRPETIWWGWAVTLAVLLTAAGFSYRGFSETRSYATEQFEELHEEHRDIRAELRTVFEEAGKQQTGEQRMRIMEKALDREVGRLDQKVPDYDLAALYEAPLHRITSNRLNLLEAALTLQDLLEARRRESRLEDRVGMQSTALEVYRRDYRNYRERPGSIDLSGFLPVDSLRTELESLRSRARSNRDYIDQLTTRVDSRLSMSAKHYEPKSEEAIRKLRHTSWLDFIAFEASRKDLGYLIEQLGERGAGEERASTGEVPSGG